MSDINKNIGLLHADAGVVNAGSVDDHYALTANFGLDNADLAGT